MKSNLSIIALLSFVLLTTACAPAPTGRPTPVNTQIIPGTGNTATQAVTKTPTQTPVVLETATPTLGSGMKLMVNEQGTPASHLVDDRGRSLYAYMTDTQSSSASSCIDDCAVDWPPLLVTGRPAAGAGIDASLLSTLVRDDGSTQVAYNGWPLYYYYMDTIPGTINGQSYNGVWFLVSPSGEPIQQ